MQVFMKDRQLTLIALIMPVMTHQPGTSMVDHMAQHIYLKDIGILQATSLYNSVMFKPQTMDPFTNAAF